MIRKSLFKLRNILYAILYIALATLIFYTIVEVIRQNKAEKISEEILQSYEISAALGQLLENLYELDILQPNYVSRNDSSILSIDPASNEKILTSFAYIENLIADNAERQYNLKEVIYIYETRHKLFNNAIRKYDSAQLQKIYTRVLASKEVKDSLINKVKNMSHYERYIISSSHEKEIQLENRKPYLISLILFCLFGFAISYYRIGKEFKILKKSNKELFVLSELFKHAQRMIDFCYTEWHLKDDKKYYSEHLYDLLGCEVNEFDPTTDNFLHYVHPDDRTFVSNSLTKIQEERDTKEQFYRILKKNGELRYFRSLAKTIDEGDDYKIRIEVLQDITQFQINRISLEERNRELENINAELASFNHIASHDLQEPLRKIQMFVSRLKDKEKENLSETTTAYLSKIDHATDRMRRLINDLLLFSSASRSEKIFEIVDLNEVLKSSETELQLAIRDTGAMIIKANLPTLLIIPFQIQQLFTNILANSIKYRNPNIQPTILIKCEKIKGKDFISFNLDENLQYFKIEIIDNGIGFEQAYAEQIFILFKRLHKPTEYPGTGLGLSICKKIIENHNGIILAEGSPGKGAKFTIFLPEILGG